MAAKLVCLGVVFLAACAVADQEKDPIPMDPPEALTCISDYYGGEPRLEDREWVLRFGDVAIPWDDGEDRSFEELLAHPARIDIRDMVAQPYEVGPLRPLTEEDGDPGYFVPPALLDAAWGSDPQQRAANLVNVRWFGKPEIHDRRYSDARLTVTDAVVPDLREVADHLDHMLDWHTDYVHPAQPPVLAHYVTGEACCRSYVPESEAPMILGEVGEHAWGIAVDMNLRYADNWNDGMLEHDVVWRNQMPQAIVEVFEDHGFAWGGRAFHYRTGQFVWRPELFDDRCQL